MSREKQIIEEMAKAMCRNGMQNGNCATDDDPCNLECVYGYCAEKLYTAGYRKQIEGEWTKHLDEYDCEYAKCSCCGEEFYDSTGEDTIDMFYNYCPSCGAKMKGGAG